MNGLLVSFIELQVFFSFSFHIFLILYQRVANSLFYISAQEPILLLALVFLSQLTLVIILELIMKQVKFNLQTPFFINSTFAALLFNHCLSCFPFS